MISIYAYGNADIYYNCGPYARSVGTGAQRGARLKSWQAGDIVKIPTQGLRLSHCTVPPLGRLQGQWWGWLR